MLSEGGQTQKTTHCAAPWIRTSGKGNIYGVGRERRDAKGPKGLCGDGTGLWSDCGGGYTTAAGAH